MFTRKTRVALGIPDIGQDSECDGGSGAPVDHAARFGGGPYEAAIAAGTPTIRRSGGYQHLKFGMSWPLRTAHRTCSKAFAPSRVQPCKRHPMGWRNTSRPPRGAHRDGAAHPALLGTADTTRAIGPCRQPRRRQASPALALPALATSVAEVLMMRNGALLPIGCRANGMAIMAFFVHQHAA